MALVRGLEGAARLLAPTQPRRALRLVAAASALRQMLGLQLAPVDRVRLETWVPGARVAVGSTTDQVVGDTSANPAAAALADALEACAATARQPTLAPA